MKYKQAEMKDIPALQALALKSWSPYKDFMSPENWQRLRTNLGDERLYEGLLHSSFSQLCEDEQTHLTGMVFLVPKGNPTDIYDSSWSYIRLLTVDPDYAGKGIGEALTQCCIDHAVESGERIIALHTSEMMHAARHLYEKLGFKILKEIPPRFGKKYWLYIKELNRD